MNKIEDATERALGLSEDFVSKVADTETRLYPQGFTYEELREWGSKLGVPISGTLDHQQRLFHPGTDQMLMTTSSGKKNLVVPVDSPTSAMIAVQSTPFLDLNSINYGDLGHVTVSGDDMYVPESGKTVIRNAIVSLSFTVDVYYLEGSTLSVQNRSVADSNYGTSSIKLSFTSTSPAVGKPFVKFVLKQGVNVVAESTPNIAVVPPTFDLYLNVLS